MKITGKLSSQLATVTFVATVMVVMCHCDNIRGDIWLTDKDSVVHFLGGIFTDANVSNFFFLSGFFVARHFGEDGWYKKAIVKRLKSLGVPYVTWSIICLGIYLLAMSFGVYTQQKEGMFTFRKVFGIGFLTDPLNGPFWYIKTLFYFIIVSPPFFWILKKFRYAFFILILAVWIVEISPFRDLPYFGFCFNLIGFACFLMGAKMAFSETMQKVFLCARRPIEGSLWLIVWIVTALCVDRTHDMLWLILHPIYVLFAVFCLQRLIACIPWRAGDILVKSAFVIYASHTMVLKIVAPVLYKLFGGIPLLCYLLLVITAVLAGVLITIAVRKVSKRALACITGGRG